MFATNFLPKFEINFSLNILFKKIKIEMVYLKIRTSPDDY